MDNAPKKICVFTCIYGNYDTLIPVSAGLKRNANCDFVCFTDSHSLRSKTWRIVRYCPYESKEFQQAFSLFKRPVHANMVNTILCRSDLRLNPTLKQYDVCVYMDANIKIINSNLIFELLSRANPSDLLVLSKHPSQRNAYQEAELCSNPPKLVKYRSLCKYQNTDLKGQIQKYRVDQFPEDYPLFWNGFIIYLCPHARDMDMFYDLYTKEMINYCRDINRRFHAQGQVSLPYVLWKLRVPVCVVPNLFGNKNQLKRRNHIRPQAKRRNKRHAAGRKK